MFLIYEVSSSFKSYIYLFFGNEMRRYFTSLDLFPYVYFYFLDSEKLRRRCFVVSPIVFPYMNLFVFFFLFRKILGEKKMSRCLLSFFFFSSLFRMWIIFFFSQNRMQRLFMSMHRLLFYYLIQEKLRRRCFVVSPIVFPICEYFLFFFHFFLLLIYLSDWSYLYTRSRRLFYYFFF